MFSRWWLKRQNIRAVHDQDLEELLSSIGVLEEMKKGAYKCDVCGDSITLDNLGAIYPTHDEIHFVCEKGICLTQSDVVGEESND